MKTLFKNRQKITLLSILFFVFMIFSPALAMSTQQEVDIGRKGGAKMEKKYGLAKQRRYAYRVAQIGKRLEAAQPRKEIKYHFKVLNSKEFNAMAFPGGYIYATKGLMDKLNDGELAFVLGHETGHVVHKHSISQAEKQILTTLGIFAITAAVNKGKINQGSANTALVLSAVMSNQYSQADERTADSEGVKLMAKAGYNPKYAVSAMKKLKKAGGGNLGVLNTFLGSHPLPDERISAVEKEGKAVAFTPSNNNPKILTGKDYDRDATSPGGMRTARETSDKYNKKSDKTRVATASGRKSLGNGGELIEPDPVSGEMKNVNYGSLNADKLRRGSSLVNWENALKESLTGVKPDLTYDSDLTQQAQKLTSAKPQSLISDERVVWVDLLKDNSSLNSFIHNFRSETLPMILSRRSDFTRAGVSVKKNSGGFIHVVVVLK